MFRKGQKIKTIGVFVVSNITPEFIVLDPYGKGSSEINERYQGQGVVEVDTTSSPKDFDGFQMGDFFVLSGEYPVVRSNETFTKITINDVMLSLPNHKLEVIA